MAASVMAWSGKTLPHSPKGWLAVISIERPLVAASDQLEQHTGLGLILADIDDVIEDQEMILVELGERTFECEFAVRDLQARRINLSCRIPARASEAGRGR